MLGSWGVASPPEVFMFHSNLLIRIALFLTATCLVSPAVISPLALAADSKTKKETAKKESAKKETPKKDDAKKPAKKEEKKDELAEGSKSHDKDKNPRKGKKFGLQGGGGYIEGLIGFGGGVDLFLGKSKPILLEGGGHYATGGAKGSTTTFMEGFGELKLFLSDMFFLSAGGGYGQKTATHPETISDKFSSWKEAATIAEFPP